MTTTAAATGTGAPAATPELVRQLVRGVHQQFRDRGRDLPRPLIIGARAQPVWEHGPVDDPVVGRIHVAACATPLAARAAIAEHGDDAAPLVLLTHLEGSSLGADLQARLVRPYLLGLSPWNAVCQRFGVRELDPEFGTEAYKWMADPLLEVPEHLMPRTAGVLTVDTALRVLSEWVFGAEGTSVERLLAATADPGFASHVASFEPRLVGDLCDALAARLGPTGELVLAMIRRGHGERALSVGLACRTLVGSATGSYGQAKVQELTGGDSPTDTALDAWARAAELALASLEANDDPAVPHVLFAGSALVGEWMAPAPGASDVLAASFEARLEHLAAALDDLLEGRSNDTSTVRDALRQVVSHRDAGTELGRVRAQRAQLAARLVTWLRDPASDRHGTLPPGNPSEVPPSLRDTAAAYEADGAWVDAARRRVGEGDDTPAPFAAVLRKIATRAHDRRADGNRFFASTLARFSADGTAADLDDSQVVPVESVLARVVAPLAKAQPTLLVVLDGCGLPQFLELAEQFRRVGLEEIGRKGRRKVGLAALPTVTEVSRTSLLSGQLRTGAAADEKQRLPAHPQVAKLPGPPAALFHHRPDLVSGVGQGLPQPVLDALSTSGPRLVAAVVNTIDDELSRGTFTAEYRIEHLAPLPALLRAAVDAGRAVVVTADHGHVLGVGLDGRGEVLRSGEGGDRWRVADREPTEDEVLLRGPRVLLGDERGILAPWHDDLRYSAKHGGYHGGATPDECLVPLSVYLPIGLEPPSGWEYIALAPPAWWDLHVEAAEEQPKKSPKKGKRPAKPPAGQGSLFEEATQPDSGPVVETSAATPTATTPWLDDLLASDLYKVQLGALVRTRLKEEQVRGTLAALHARGGTASFGVIAQAAGMPLMRVSGFLANLARVLNVDGYGVLAVDPSAQEARLNEQLLLTQFLEGAP